MKPRLATANSADPEHEHVASADTVCNCAGGVGKEAVGGVVRRVQKHGDRGSVGF